MAGLSCPATTVKYFLFLFNFIFWIVGAVILGTGIWVLVDNDASQYMHIATIESSEQMVHSAGGLFVAVGVFIFIIAFFGCCGAVKQNGCMLMTYAIIVGFVLFLQILAGILGAVFKNKIQDELHDSMMNTVNTKYGTEGNEDITESWNFMQRTMKCCGVDEPKDWENSAWRNSTTQVIPDTCCVLLDQNSDSSRPLNSTKCQDQVTGFFWNEGCEQKMEDWINSHLAILIGVAFGLMFIEIFVIVSACCLRRSIVSQYEYV